MVVVVDSPKFQFYSPLVLSSLVAAATVAAARNPQESVFHLSLGLMDLFFLHS